MKRRLETTAQRRAPKVIILAKFKAGHVVSMGERRRAYTILVGIPKEMRPLGRLRRRWENENIKMYLKETGWASVTGFIWLWVGTSGGLL
jgi:hypothetical protein